MIGAGAGAVAGRDSGRSLGSAGVLSAVVIAGLALAACQTPTQTNQQARVLSGNADTVSVVAGIEANPRPLAEAHCAQYGKQASIRDTAPADPNFTKGWLVGTRAFVHRFACL